MDAWVGATKTGTGTGSDGEDGGRYATRSWNEGAIGQAAPCALAGEQLLRETGGDLSILGDLQEKGDDGERVG